LSVIRLPIPSKIATQFFLHLKSYKFAFSKISVFILFFDFYFGKKKVNLENNPEMGYDTVDETFAKAFIMRPDEREVY
jgi:hypothetical protein